MSNHTFEETYDYVVVGAGSAGCVVAARLSENPEARVLLLEGGGPATHPDVIDPSKWPTLFKGDLDWGYDTTPLRSCDNRVDHVPRGKMLGGCHSHNASVWVRGHPSDFDGWTLDGNPGWSWSEIHPLYKRMEDWQGPSSELRGTGGPVYVEPVEDPNPVATAFVESGPAVGLPRVEDNNGSSMEGTSFFNMTIKDGKRHSVVQAYLQPALDKTGLTVRTHAVTHRVLIDAASAVGVEYQHDGGMRRAAAEKEIVLCAGVIGSPQLLSLSGIGPEEELKALDIPVTANLSGVGRNLHDHVLVAGINYECQGSLPEVRNNGAESTMWWKSDSRMLGPDIQPVIIEFPFATPEVADRLPNENCYAIAPSVVRPASRGSVRLVSSDPAVAPAIDVNFMARDADVNAMLSAVELCREMGASSAFGDLRKREVMPGYLPRSEMIKFIRQAATTYFHPTSTCKMGVDDEAVVDPELRVYGIDGLRVADASIMPRATSGNTNAPSMMIGEKAAEMILAAQ